MVDRELLIRTVLEVVRECQGTDMNDERDRGQCFSCGFLVHGVNHCTQGNEGWFGREGASRTISNNNTPDPGWGRRLVWNRPKDDNHGPRWIPDVQGFPVPGSLTPGEKDRRDRTVQKYVAVVDEDSEVDPLCRPEGLGAIRLLWAV